MPTKKGSNIRIPFPELLFPYSPVAKPMPPPPISNVCEGDLLCVSFSCALVPYLLGLLEVYRYKDSFTGTDEEKTIAVGVMRQLMEVLAMSGCGCDDPIGVPVTRRINPETGQLEVSSDGGDTWQTDPQSPYVRAVQMPPLGGENGDAKRCLAANNVIFQMKLLQESYSSKIGTLEDLTTLIASLIVDAAAVFFLPLLGDALVQFVMPLVAKMFQQFQWMLGITSEQYDELFTEENWDTMQCILYCRGNDNGLFTTADIQDIVADTRAQLGSGVQEAGANMAAMIDFWSAVGTNNAASIEGGEESECDDCACGNCSNLENWEVIFGNVVEQSPGFMRVESVDNGAGQHACRLANYGGGESCCAVTYEVVSGVATNQAYYPCGSGDPIFSVPPAETCMYDINVNNVFLAPLTVEFTFIDCP